MFKNRFAGPSRLEALGVDYFTPSIKVGEWKRDQISAAYSTLERNITEFIKKPGHYRLTVRHDEGNSDVHIQWAALVENGRELSRDIHEGLSGIRDRAHNYRFRIDSIKSGAKYTIRVNLRSDGGSDASGSFMLRHFKE